MTQMEIGPRAASTPRTGEDCSSICSEQASITKINGVAQTVLSVAERSERGLLEKWAATYRGAAS
jgi:hypothetical protein